jgi:hypothetical protein
LVARQKYFVVQKNVVKLLWHLAVGVTSVHCASFFFCSHTTFPKPLEARHEKIINKINLEERYLWFTTYVNLNFFGCDSPFPLYQKRLIKIVRTSKANSLNAEQTCEPKFFI